MRHFKEGSGNENEGGDKSSSNNNNNASLPGVLVANKIDLVRTQTVTSQITILTKSH